MSLLLAFGHQSRVGKDTCVNEAVRYLNELKKKDPALPWRSVRKRSFFTAGKDSAYEIFKCYGLERGEFYDREEHQHLRDVKLPGVNKTPMEIWLDYGAMVREIHEPAFADRAVYDLPEGEFSVFTSLRYPTEVEAIRRLGGWFVKVERIPQPPLRPLDVFIPPDFEWDAHILNAGTLEDLRGLTREVVSAYLGNELTK